MRYKVCAVGTPVNPLLQVSDSEVSAASPAYSPNSRRGGHRRNLSVANINQGPGPDHLAPPRQDGDTASS